MDPTHAVMSPGGDNESDISLPGLDDHDDFNGELKPKNNRKVFDQKNTMSQKSINEPAAFTNVSMHNNAYTKGPSLEQTFRSNLKLLNLKSFKSGITNEQNYSNYDNTKA
jgi:hypothetical protein